MPDVYGFTAEQVGRVVAAVETVEGRRPTEGAAAPGPRPQAAPLHHVKVTSTTLSSGFYPAAIQLYDSSTQTWSDGGAVNFLSSNGDAPTLNRLYLARAVGIYASNGKPIYARDVLAGGGGSLAVNTTNNGTGDTTVSVSGVSTIQIDQGSGLKLVNVSGVAKVGAQDASLTHAGVVSTGTQTFKGDKTFVNSLTVDGSSNGFSTPSVALRGLSTQILRCPISATLYVSNSFVVYNNSDATGKIALGQGNGVETPGPSIYSQYNATIGSTSDLLFDIGGTMNWEHVVSGGVQYLRLNLYRVSGSTRAPCFAIEGTEGISQTATIFFKKSDGVSNGSLSITVTGGAVTALSVT